MSINHNHVAHVCKIHLNYEIDLCDFNDAKIKQNEARVMKLYCCEVDCDRDRRDLKISSLTLEDLSQICETTSINKNIR